jgi:phage tail sheath gpL-like
MKISKKIICAAIANTFIAAPVFAGAFVGAVANTSTAPGQPTQPLTIRVAPGLL